MKQKIHITYIIDDLQSHNAHALYRVLAHLDHLHFESTVIHLGQEHPLGQRIQSHGILVYHLNIRTLPGIGWNLRKLNKLLNELQPDLVHGWGYYGSLVATLSCKNLIPVIWSIQGLPASQAELGWATRWAIQTAAKNSPYAERITYDTADAARQHHALGYTPEKTQVIPYGIDSQQFQPDPYLRETTRQALKIPDDAIVIGMVGNIGLAGLALFVAAATQLMRHHAKVYFLVAGTTNFHQWGHPLLSRTPYPNRIKVVGKRDDIASLLNALDIFTLTDYREDEPHYLLEAMACGVPCIAISKDGTALPLGGAGRWLDVGHVTASALAFAWLEWLQAGQPWHTALGTQARHHILRHYSIQNVVNNHQNNYKSVFEETSTLNPRVKAWDGQPFQVENTRQTYQ